MKEDTVPKSHNSKQKMKLFCTAFLNKIDNSPKTKEHCAVVSSISSWLCIRQFHTSSVNGTQKALNTPLSGN